MCLCSNPSLPLSRLDKIVSIVIEQTIGMQKELLSKKIMVNKLVIANITMWRCLIDRVTVLIHLMRINGLVSALIHW